MTPTQSLQFSKTSFEAQQNLFLLNFHSPDKYNLESIINYYSSFTIADNFCLNKTSENKALKIIKEIEISKAASMNKLSGQFLRDAAEILSRPICEM